jgi:hypothetical protein
MTTPKTEAVAEKPDRAALRETGRRIGRIQNEFQVAFKEADNDIDRASVLACAIIDLRQAVRAYLPILQQLQGSRLGFRTDKDKDGGYPAPVLIDCAIEAAIRGARWTGNEFNILAGGCYLTKEYWSRQVNSLEGLTDLDLNPNVPELVNGRVVVEYVATWQYNGTPGRMVRRIPIIVRHNQTDDATLGKAEARILKAIHRRLTGTETTEAADDEPATIREALPADPPAADPPAEAEPAAGEVLDDRPAPDGFLLAYVDALELVTDPAGVDAFLADVAKDTQLSKGARSILTAAAIHHRDTIGNPAAPEGRPF